MQRKGQGTSSCGFRGIIDGVRMQELLTARQMESPESGMVQLAFFETLREAQEYSLVVLAMRLDCLITVEQGAFVIHVEGVSAAAVQNEFRLYEAEEAAVRPPETLRVFGSGVELLFIWIVTLFFCYTVQLERPSFTDTYLNSAHAVMGQGEFHRSFTALFLHGSLDHLLGNIAYGSIFCLLVANSLGPWTGWGLILASGTLANFLNAVLHQNAAFFSLGASTATFGALGLLVGVGLYQAWLSRTVRSGIRVVVPLAIGVMFFSMFGIGRPDPEAPTDVMAHVLGLLCGGLLGYPVALLRHRRGSA